MYRIELRRRAQKSLDNLIGTEFERIIEAIKDLRGDPRPRGVEKIKLAGLWRIREGDYRVVYHIDDKDKLVVIVKIGHRREVYRAI